jgi:hypothetical protein
MNPTLDLVLKIAGPVVAVAALVVSILGTKNALRVANKALAKAEKDEKYELANLLWQTKELCNKVKFLDEYIYKQNLFTRREDILEALAAIRKYWVDNGAALGFHLGKDGRTYKIFRGLYEVALANENNQPPPNGQGEWRGITQENVMGNTVEQIIFYATTELERKNK